MGFLTLSHLDLGHFPRTGLALLKAIALFVVLGSPPFPQVSELVGHALELVLDVLHDPKEVSIGFSKG